MIIEVKRKLENNVFSTTLERVTRDGDANCQIEAKLENDFGPVVVKTGGVFSANVTGTKENITVTPVEDGSEANFKFCVDLGEVPLVKGAQISFSCKAAEQSAMKISEEITLSPLQVAEQRCRVFEALIKSRIKKTVEAWKEQQTDFEDEVVPDLEISLLK